MEREVSIPLGVVVEKRASRHPWGEDSWRPVAVMAQPAAVAPWTELLRGDGFLRYHAGNATMTLHRKETEAYLHNLEAREPALYVVLRPTGEAPWPVEVFDVTASPYAAQDYLDSAEDIVERVPIPPDVLELIGAFVATHHVEEGFRKRKRDKADVDKPGFGKQPVFNGRRRPGKAKLDG